MRDLQRGVNEFENNRPRNKLVKDDNIDLLADSQNIFKRWKNYFCQLLNVHDVNDVRQTEMQTAEPLLPEYCSIGVEIAIEKLIQEGGNTLCSDIHRLINSISNKEEIPGIFYCTYL